MGKSPAHWASIRKNIPLLDMIAKAGADLSLFDYTGKSPLTYAIQQEDEEMVKVVCRLTQALLDHKVPPWKDRNIDYIEYTKNPWVNLLVCFYRKVGFG